MYSFSRDTFGAFTEAEQAFAISQLDPFHDTPYRVEGAPSDGNSDSVIMTYNQEITINSALFGLPTTEGSKWDFHVAILPMVQQATFYSGRLETSCRLTAGGSSDESPYCQLYPITVFANTSGSKTFVYDAGYPAPVGMAPNIGGFFSNTSTGIFVPRTLRVIGQSFEVVDETPKFYQQGSCTTYSRPSNVVKGWQGTFVQAPAGATAAASQVLRGTQCAAPPNDIRQVTILPNSKTWKSSEGAYVVGKNFDSDNRFERLGTNDLILYNPNDPDTATIKNSFWSREQVNQYNAKDNLLYSDSFNRTTNYNISGAYFTGVSGQYGTYRIRSKIIYEILPDPTDTSLIPLTTPTIPRNPVFERILRETVAAMPAGVPQTMNPKGELWGLVIKTAKKVAKSVISNPAGALQTASNVGMAFGGNPAPLMAQVASAGANELSKAVERGRTRERSARPPARRDGSVIRTTTKPKKGKVIS